MLFSKDLAGKFNLLHMCHTLALDRRQTHRQTDKLTTITLAHVPSIDNTYWCANTLNIVKNIVQYCFSL